MLQFQTYKIGISTGGSAMWYWQVIKTSGPLIVVVARSGHGYVTEAAAIADYHDFVTWASGPDASTPPSAESI